MNALQLQLCDIQGRLFVLSGSRGYDSVPFIKSFIKSDAAKGFDSKYNRMQWAGEEYLLAELEDSAKLRISKLIQKYLKIGKERWTHILTISY